MDCRFRHSKHILKNLHPLIFIGMDKIRHRRPVFRKRHPRFNVSHGCQIIKNTWLCLNQRKAEKSHGCQILENTWLCLKQRKAEEIHGCQILENTWLCLNQKKTANSHNFNTHKRGCRQVATRFRRDAQIDAIMVSL